MAATVWHSFKLRYYVTTAAGKVAVNWIQLCYNGDLRDFHQSRETEISLRKSSRRNLTRIVRENRIRSMRYSVWTCVSARSGHSLYYKAPNLTSDHTVSHSTQGDPPV